MIRFFLVIQFDKMGPSSSEDDKQLCPSEHRHIAKENGCGFS